MLEIMQVAWLAWFSLHQQTITLSENEARWLKSRAKHGLKDKNETPVRPQIQIEFILLLLNRHKKTLK
jgi:hypothetical protein